MSEACDILDSTAGESYWVTLKFSRIIHFISFRDGDQKWSAGKQFVSSETGDILQSDQQLKAEEHAFASVQKWTDQRNFR